MHGFLEGCEARQTGAKEEPLAAFRYHKGLRGTDLHVLCWQHFCPAVLPALPM